MLSKSSQQQREIFSSGNKPPQLPVPLFFCSLTFHLPVPWISGPVGVCGSLQNLNKWVEPWMGHYCSINLWNGGWALVIDPGFQGLAVKGLQSDIHEHSIIWNLHIYLCAASHIFLLAFHCFPFIWGMSGIFCTQPVKPMQIVFAWSLRNICSHLESLFESNPHWHHLALNVYVLFMWLSS